ncbi:MAG: biotin--[acetyl-CoA-carboxylase] ligase [Verrucomicrobiota bacterium]|jgi:BirA family biotin operon repressor/biotin-[acetyl-CoA-carboxylase] ligase
MGLDYRKSILEALRDSVGEWVSGQQLCHEFGISRMAVSKHVRALRQQGYEIEAAPRKGYRFHDGPNLLFPEEIRSNLQTEVFGQGLIEYAEVMESTHLRAEELALSGYREGTLVVAESQTHGRGRRGRSWYSGTRTGLCMSVVMRPPFAPDWAAILALTSVLAVAEGLLEASKLPIRICWPNDLFIGERKLGGVLVEVSSDVEAISYMVVGIGLNINQSKMHFPTELRDQATSLRMESGKVWDRVSIMQKVLFHLEKLYWALDDGMAKSILQRWRELDLLLGRAVSLETMEGVINGTAMDISPDGKLILQDDHGKLIPVIGGKLKGHHPPFPPPSSSAL